MIYVDGMWMTDEDFYHMNMELDNTTFEEENYLLDDDGYPIDDNGKRLPGYGQD